MVPADDSYYEYLTIGGELTDLYAAKTSLLYGPGNEPGPEHKYWTAEMNLIEQAIVEIVYDHSCTKLKEYTELSAEEYSRRYPLTAYHRKTFNEYMIPGYLENLPYSNIQ